MRSRILKRRNRKSIYIRNTRNRRLRGGSNQNNLMDTEKDTLIYNKLVKKCNEWSKNDTAKYNKLVGKYNELAEKYNRDISKTKPQEKPKIKENPKEIKEKEKVEEKVEEEYAF